MNMDECRILGHIEFKPHHHYLVFLNPIEVDFDGLANLPPPAQDEGIEILFIPAIPFRSGEGTMDLKVLDFETVKAVKDWLEDISGKKPN